MSANKLILILLLALLLGSLLAWFYSSSNSAPRIEVPPSNPDSAANATLPEGIITGSAGRKSALDGSAKLGQFLKQALSAGQGKDTAFVKFGNDGTVQVYVELLGTDSTSLEQLSVAGMTVEVVNSELKKVQGWASPETLQKLVENQNVIRITAPGYSNQRDD